MASLLHILAVAIIMITGTQSLRCAPPETVNCTAPKETVEQECHPLGVAKDICNHCWICAKGFKEECGGLWNMGGTCNEGLYCSNPYTGEIDINNQRPGICCKNTTQLIGKPVALPPCKSKAVRNPCSQEYECEKEHGEVCGGPGGINGVCASNLVCYPPLSDATRFENSTCVFPSEIPSTTTPITVT